jgi:hypothetical protein
VTVDWSEFTAEELAALHDWWLCCVVRLAITVPVPPPSYRELLGREHFAAFLYSSRIAATDNDAAT